MFYYSSNIDPFVIARRVDGGFYVAGVTAGGDWWSARIKLFLYLLMFFEGTHAGFLILPVKVLVDRSGTAGTMLRNRSRNNAKSRSLTHLGEYEQRRCDDSHATWNEKCLLHTCDSDWQLRTADYVDTLWDNLTHFYCNSLSLMSDDVFMALKVFKVCQMKNGGNSPMRLYWKREKRISYSGLRDVLQSTSQSYIEAETTQTAVLQMWNSIDWYWKVLKMRVWPFAFAMLSQAFFLFFNHQCCIFVNLSVFFFVVCASLLSMIHSPLKDVHKRSLYVTILRRIKEECE